MSVTNPERVVTKQDLADFYDELLPFISPKSYAGFTPIGTIISIFGESAPANYLICDGSTYNVADYPELCAHLWSLTTNSQYKVSGDATKFKVPDLRGEFLRGTGTNSHTASANGRTYTEGSGANVGVHQKATWMPDLTTNANSAGTGAAIRGLAFTDDKYYVTTGQDSTLNKGTGDTIVVGAGGIVQSTSSTYIGGTVRPTNTSVLFCIATKNIYLDPKNDYSTEEKVIGTWIDGSTIYQKTITLQMPSSGNDTIQNVSSLSIAQLVDLRATHDGSTIIPVGGYLDAQYAISSWYDKASTSLYVRNKNSNLTTSNSVYITLQYTKTT